MAADTSASVDAPDVEVMASVDPAPSGPRLVIADVTRDDAWLSVGQGDAPTLPDWR
jgi:hypothetical protein